ncbi:MAG: zinc-ribbon domain-containing protein, partial [Desulfobacterales bacterium]|nr:zinc-ribbon domain-containing protein [Desulfobacterales bacterium]
MIITCNECDTRFNIDESLLKQTGSKVRCSKCKNVFLAYPSSPSEELDKSGDVETKVEAVITDEKTETDEQYKAEEESEGIELAMDETFEENTKVEEKPEEAGLELEFELELEPDIDETQAETEAGLELESGDKTDSEISTKEEPEGIEQEEIAKETEIKIEESKQEDIDQDKTPGEDTAEKIEEKEESSKTFNMGTTSDEQEAEKTIEPIDKAENGALTEKSEPPKVAANKRISMPVLLLLLAALLISG